MESITDLKTADYDGRFFIGKHDVYADARHDDQEIWANVKDINTGELYICDSLIGRPDRASYALFQQIEHKPDRCRYIALNKISFIGYDKRKDSNSKIEFIRKED